MTRYLATRVMVLAAVAAAGAVLAACSSPAAPAATPATPAATVPAAAATPLGTATPSATPSATAAAAALWCGVQPTPVRAASLTAWLNGPGYAAVQTVEASLAALQAPDVPAATVAALSGSLCSAVGESESLPPPADVADYNTAMTDFVKATVILHANPEASGQSEAAPGLTAGTVAFDTFLDAIGRPA